MRQESKLDTPVTRMAPSTEITPWGEESTSWPVTPYTIRVRSFYDSAVDVELFVDGTMVDDIIISANGKVYTCLGFVNADGSIREFQFTFPRFPRSEFDRMDASLLSKLGTISVVVRPATFMETRVGRSCNIVTDFKQANKKDADLAGGSRFMSTTRAGDTMYGRRSWARGAFALDFSRSVGR